MDNLKQLVKIVTKIQQKTVVSGKKIIQWRKSRSRTKVVPFYYYCGHRNIKNRIGSNMYFFSLQVSNGEYSCYVDLKSFYSVKSSAEYLARIFALKNSGQEGSRKKAKRTCQKLLNNLPSSVFKAAFQALLWTTHICCFKPGPPATISYKRELFKSRFHMKRTIQEEIVYLFIEKAFFEREKFNSITLQFSEDRT